MKNHFIISLFCLLLALSVLGGCNPSSSTEVNKQELDSISMAQLCEERSCGHEYVDLGICNGLKWATMNLGAKEPEQAGWYFAWGQTEIIEGNDHLFVEKVYCESNLFTRYLDYPGPLEINGYKIKHGPVDHKRTLDFSDDAARQIWGGGWRLPDANELDSLMHQCTWTRDTINNIQGYRVISHRPGYEGNSIFLPFAGVKQQLSHIYYNASGFYWARNLLKGADLNGTGIIASNKLIGTSFYYRFLGQSIRPVFRPDEVVATSVSLDTTTLHMNVKSKSRHLQFTITPSDATYQQVFWGSSNVNVAEVDSVGNVTPIGPGLCYISANTIDGTGLSAMCRVYIADSIPPSHECVDMMVCNHLRWATMNVGATTPSEIGEEYDWEQASHLLWGNHFRMPTEAEWDSLRVNCQWEWTEQDGRPGYNVKSEKTGNSIFLPANVTSGQGTYWSSTSYSSLPSAAYTISFDARFPHWSYSFKNKALPVRMVFE